MAADLFRLPDLKLERLGLSGQSLTDEDVIELCARLKGQTQLTFLDLSYNDIGNEGAKALADWIRHSSIRIIWLHRNRFGNIGVWHLADAVQDHLTLEFCSVANQYMDHHHHSFFQESNILSKCRNGEPRVLVDLPVKLDGLLNRLSATDVPSLEIDRFLSNSFALGSYVCPSIRHLYVGNCVSTFTREGYDGLIEALTFFPNLTHLALPGNHLSDACANRLWSALAGTAVTELNLSNNALRHWNPQGRTCVTQCRLQVNDLDWQCLNVLVQLGVDQVRINQNHGFFVGLPRLTTLPWHHLRELRISYTHMERWKSEQLVASLGPALEILHVVGCGWADMMQVEQLIDRCPELQTLCIHNNPFGMPGQAVVQGLAHRLMHPQSRLRTLTLSACRLNALDAFHLSVMLRANQRLQLLDLSGNPLRQLGGLVLADAFEINTTLWRLNLSECRLTDAVLTAFARALAGNRCSFLHLDMQHIGETFFQRDNVTELLWAKRGKVVISLCEDESHVPDESWKPEDQRDFYDEWFERFELRTRLPLPLRSLVVDFAVWEVVSQLTTSN